MHLIKFTIESWVLILHNLRVSSLVYEIYSVTRAFVLYNNPQCLKVVFELTYLMFVKITDSPDIVSP